MNWYDYPIVVPFNNPLYDAALGGSHDLTVGCPPNTPITAILSGVVCDISAPSWGKQVGIKLDTPYKSIPYMAFLHLSAVQPGLKLGDHVTVGDVLGWSGGASLASQYNGTSNPTGENFLNSPFQSSQPQVGIALTRGPVYGEGAGWTTKPDPALDPTGLLSIAKAGVQVGVIFTDREKQLWTRVENVPLNEEWAIPQSWVMALRRTHYFGVPVEPEVNHCQAFTGAYAKWDAATGKVHWFTYQGEYIIPA